jgi:hypothetical protein
MAHNQENEHDVSHIRNPGGAHEHRDANVRAVFGFLITLAVVGLIIQLLLFAMFRYLKGYYQAQQAQPNPMVQPLPAEEPPSVAAQKRPCERTKAAAAFVGDATREVAAFPTPKLQADPPCELNQMRLVENKTLDGYWVGPDGVVRIPIDEAMKLTLERGLPTQPANLAAVQGGKAPAKGNTQPVPGKK